MRHGRTPLPCKPPHLPGQNLFSRKLHVGATRGIVSVEVCPDLGSALGACPIRASKNTVKLLAATSPRLNARANPFGMRIAFEKKRRPNMDSNYVFLCGVMWCRYGEQEAGKELLRATSSSDLDTRTLAWAMLAKGMSDLRNKY
jgi:hypothetical protein